MRATHYATLIPHTRGLWTQSLGPQCMACIHPHPLRPIRTWSAIFSRLDDECSSIAVVAHVIPLYLPIRSNTFWFCTTNSRVGQMHKAWG